MAVNFGGMASGMDTNALIDGLRNAALVPANTMAARAAGYRAASSTISQIGTNLASLKTALSGLSSMDVVGSYKATSSTTGITVTSSPTAQPGAYNVTVAALAREQRTYSTTYASKTAALGLAGTMTLQVGTGTAQNVDVVAGDTLEGIAAKINSTASTTGIRVNAAILYDGANYRLQVRGLDTGSANNVTFTGAMSTTMALDVPANTVQSAQNAQITVDTYTVSRPTNDFADVIPGVTMTAKEVSATAVRVEVAADATTLKDKVHAIADAFNKVVSSGHFASGYGSNKATNPYLAGDSAVRSVEQKLGSWTSNTYVTGGAYTRLSDVGITLNKDGGLTIDDAKLMTAFTTDPKCVSKLFARDLGAVTGGAMATLKDSIDILNLTGTGTVPGRAKMFDDRASALDKRIDAEKLRVDQYVLGLRKQFANMETEISKSKTAGSSISLLG